LIQSLVSLYQTDNVLSSETREATQYHFQLLLIANENDSVIFIRGFTYSDLLLYVLKYDDSDTELLSCSFQAIDYLDYLHFD